MRAITLTLLGRFTGESLIWHIGRFHLENKRVDRQFGHEKPFRLVAMLASFL